MGEGREIEEMPADAQLVNRTLAGDLESFGELHHRYFERLTRTVVTILRDRVRAEDVAQEAYQSALESLPRLADPNRFFPWLRRIAVNRAVEETRRAGRRDRLHSAWSFHRDPAAAIPSKLDRLLEDERADVLRQAVQQLPEKQRAAVVLRFFQGLSVRETAAALDCREVTVRTNVFRALQRLGSMLTDHNEEAT